MYGSHTLRARHYASKPQHIDCITLTNTHPAKIPNGTNTTNMNPNTENSNKSTCNPSTNSNNSPIKPTSISTSNSSSSSSSIHSSNGHKKKTSAPISPTSPSKSHKHHKKKRNKTNRDKHTHAPLLIFPYSWNSSIKDEKCSHNKQFHKKCKPMSARISMQHGIDHLLSPSKCSKRYLSAYCLNLHQLTTSSKLVECIIKKLTPVIKQLHHITNEINDNKNINIKNNNNIISPSISPTDNEIISPLLSPFQSPIQTCTNTKPSNNNMSNIQLNIITDEQDHEHKTDENDIIFSPMSLSQSKTTNSMSAAMSMMNLKITQCKNKTIATSLPTHGLVAQSIHTSNLDLVETRSCPDLDTEYTNISDENENENVSTPPDKPPIIPSMCMISSKSTPMLFPKKTQDNKPKQEQQQHKEQNKLDYKTKMKAYCIATIKHNIDIIYHWIYYYPSDFADSKLLDTLLTYISRVRNKTPSSNSIQRRWSKLLQLIQHRKPDMKYSSILSSSISNLRIIPKVRKHDRKTSFQFTDSFFPPREMVQKLGGGIDLLKIHPALVADQLTLIDTEIFLQIKPREFTNRSWQDRPTISNISELPCDDGNDPHNISIFDKLNRQKIKAPNLLYMIDHVNRLSLWVATEILSRNTTAEMADLTKYFYVVSHRCLELCNIHTCTAIFGGICLQPLTRLRRLNRYLSDDEQIQQLHRALNEMVNSNSNYKTYRNFIEQWYNTHSNTPCIPFIPVVMKDLFQIQLNLINKKDEIKCIDLGLLEKNCRHIRRVYETQQKAKLYANQLPADTDIQSKLRMNIAKFETHEILRQWSFEIQPKLTKEDKENLEMIDTLEEFGFL